MGTLYPNTNPQDESISCSLGAMNCSHYFWSIKLYILSRKKKKPFSDVETFSTETHFMSFDPFSASWFTMLDDALISQLLGVRASTTYLLLWFCLCSSCSSLAIWNGWRNSTVFCWLVTHPVSHNAEDKEEYDQNVYNIGNNTKWSIHTTSYLIFKRENKPFISSSMHAVIDQYVTLKKF